MIRRISSSQIDQKKYNILLQNSAAESFYAQKTVLDLLCDSWELLVKGDYEAAMPVPLKRKWTQTFVVSPIYCQQLGVFSAKNNPQDNELFLKYLNENYSVLYYPFNHTNTFESDFAVLKNYVWQHAASKNITGKYSKGRKYDVAKSKPNLHIVKLDWNVEIIIFCKTYFKGLDKKSDVEAFLNFVASLVAENKVEIAGAFLNSELISIAIVTISQDSKILLALINHPQFLQKNGASVLIDHLLHEMGEDQSFDFMGGNVRGIEIFFKSFGAELQTFPVVRNSKKDLFKKMIGWK